MVKVTEEIKEIFKILSIEVNSEQDLFTVLISRDLLLRVDIEQQLTCLIIKLKEKYKSSKLNCLHKNRDDKQKFPGINLVRQILRCNGYHLKPVKFSRGYCKHSGKKIVDRNFKVVRLENYQEIKMAQDKVESELSKKSESNSTKKEPDSDSSKFLIELIDNSSTIIPKNKEPIPASIATSIPPSIAPSIPTQNNSIKLETPEIKEIELNF